MNIDPGLQALLTSIASGLVYILLGSTGGALTFYFGQRNLKEQMKLEWAKLEETKKLNESVVLKGAAETVQISADVMEQQKEWLEKRFADMQKKIDEQDEHLKFADEKQIVAEEIIRGLESDITLLKASQVSYRRVVKQALEEIMNELGNGHTPDLTKLKQIVDGLLKETGESIKELP